MNTLDKIKSLDKKFSWSFFGFLIGILGFGYAIYVDQFKIVKPRLVFDILSKTQVFDLKENVNELKIIYNGENLQKKNENLILITLKIMNDGDKDIKEDDFLSQVPFGLKVIKGKIAETPQILNASNVFLRKYLKISYDSLNVVHFNKTQIDRNQYFTIKILTICKNTELPEIIPIGKVSGMVNDFYIRRAYTNEKENKTSFFEKLNSGSFGIHIARFFYYLICIMLFSFLIGFPASKIASTLDKKKKKKIIQKYRKKTKIKLSEKVELLFDMYMDFGESSIKLLDDTANNERKLIILIDFIKKQEEKNKLIDDYEREVNFDNEIIQERRYTNSINYVIIKRLLDKKIIIKEENKINFDETFKEELKEFRYFLELQ